MLHSLVNMQEQDQLQLLACLDICSGVVGEVPGMTSSAELSPPSSPHSTDPKSAVGGVKGAEVVEETDKRFVVVSF